MAQKSTQKLKTTKSTQKLKKSYYGGENVYRIFHCGTTAAEHSNNVFPTQGIKKKTKPNPSNYINVGRIFFYYYFFILILIVLAQNW